VKAITERKAAYIAEAIRVASLSDSEFEDYVQGWTPLKITR